MSRVNGEIVCDDCAGWDIEWMYHCSLHGTDHCRGCCCPECAEDSLEDYDDLDTCEHGKGFDEDCEWCDYEEDGPQDLETTLDNALERAEPRRLNGE